MNSFIITIFLATVCCCYGVMLSDDEGNPVETTKIGKGRFLFPPMFIPLPLIPTPAPSQTTRAPVAGTTATTTASPNSGTCPGRCCKTYCLAGNFCTAGTGGAAPICDPSTVTPKKCLNTAGTGCSACTPANSCATECGAVMNISPVAFCPT